MPAKNRIKQYLANGYYHVYNRGVEKRTIFQDKQDHQTFLSFLKEYLEPKDENAIRTQVGKTPHLKRDKLLKKISMNNYFNEITLLAFCLMPNHFHLLLKQKKERGIVEFMRSLSTRYVMYFNKKYKRSGGLFQGRYKAVLIKTDEQLLHISRYIHLNPSYKGRTLYSSLAAYLGGWKADWLETSQILSFFSHTNNKLSYRSFIMDYSKNKERDKLIIEKLKID